MKPTLLTNFLLFVSIVTFGQKPQVVIPSGHSEDVYSIAYSPASIDQSVSARYFVTTSGDGRAIIWESTGGHQLRSLDGHGGYSVYSAEFSPATSDDPMGGKFILTSSGDKTAKLWETNSGKLLTSFEGHSLGVTSAKFSPDGRFVVTVSQDYTSRIWETASGKLLYTLSASSDARYLAEFSTAGPTDPKGGKYIFSYEDGNAKVWETATGKLVHSCATIIPGPTGNYVYSQAADLMPIIYNGKSHIALDSLQGALSVTTPVQFSPDGNLIVAGASDHTIRFWDAHTGALTSFIAASSTTKEIKFSPSCTDDKVGGKYVATANSNDQTATLWDARTRKLLYVLKGHADSVVHVQFSADGKLLLTSTENDIKLWEPASGKLVRSFEGVKKASTAELSPDHKFIILPDSYANEFINTTTGKAESFNNELVGLLSADCNGTYIGTISSDRNFKQWDAQTGKLVYSKPTGGRPHDVIYSQDHKFVLVRSSLHGYDSLPFVTVFDVTSGKVQCSIPSVVKASFSPDGKYIVADSQDGIVRIHDVLSGKLLHHHASSYYNLSDKYFFTFQDGTVTVLDVRSGETISLITDAPDPIKRVSFRGDNKSLLTEHSTGIKIWDIASGKLISAIAVEDFDGAVYSPNEKYALVNVTDQSKKIYDVSSGKVLYSFSHDDASGYSGAFDESSKLIATVSAADDVNLWNAGSGKLIHKFSNPDPDRSFIPQFPSINPDHPAPYFFTISKKDYSTSVTYDYKFWDTSSGQLLADLKQVGWGIYRDALKTKMLCRNSRGIKGLTWYDFKTSQELLSFVPWDSADWVVTHPSGLFDASPGAMSKMYFVSGMEIIGFEQLKARYYEPGLWKKVMKGEKLRAVGGSAK